MLKGFIVVGPVGDLIAGVGGRLLSFAIDVMAYVLSLKEAFEKLFIKAEGVSNWKPLTVHFVLSARDHLFASSCSIISSIYPLPGIHCSITFDTPMDVCPVV
ncbi:hypothetical protein GO730_35925 [Spirosoma sp. HMF3257]|uniref:hypothetical protein n=1 Tax=Spirosoma telluris TaxID=2183553 RepID=UPI0011B9382E|nr:hypothetical protein [Spirosoma telluris]